MTIKIFVLPKNLLNVILIMCILIYETRKIFPLKKQIIYRYRANKFY